MTVTWPSAAEILAQISPGAALDLPLTAPIWLAWRRDGKMVSSGWQRESSLQAALAAARQRLAGRDADLLELCLTRDWQRVPPDRITQSFPNLLRGRVGMALRYKGQEHLVSPLHSIASNRAPLRELENLAAQQGLKSEALHHMAEIWRFDAGQFVIALGPTPRAEALYRGSPLVPPEAVGPDLMRQTIDDLCQWMRNNLHSDGRMTYKYWPSRGVESSADNTIRQFMASVALGRIARRSGLATDAAAARANLGHNLEKYHRLIEGLGAICHGGSSKLGAMALAALAILEFRQYGLIAADAHAEAFTALCAGVDHLWQEDGAFRTFLIPADRNDNQNFYPGEALLFWASLHRATRDPGLAARCRQSFRYYRDWHLENPNPAFVPWHSQAYVMLWQDLGWPELADFVLARNDWLLEMQQWAGKLPEDCRGRFYNPAHPEYGPPHASSTGVYMEGLADAWQLAQSLGDAARAAAYAQALMRGIRSIRQLQFRDPLADAFYIHRKKAVMGGLRTEGYNNEIRVDNVQHCLMALLKIEAAADFPWAPLRRD